ncbi:hypothetical protein HHK36_007661 [Tetracentron sinense]|uniref:Light-regulated protein n=1 Tax=Tetracentron sinense TaxID=13715 RepID=A0A834ZN00_TETSI|nr:hypothetical protein HHK36_007661 [Tetracentron sinense]
MQAALCFAPPLTPLTPTRTSVTLWRSAPKLNTTLVSQPPPIKATAAAAAMANDTSTVDYSSTASVFPAEACETIGGEACDAEIYPEAKLKPEARSAIKAAESVDREYFEYDEPKTVFPGEACDDLGGEFCEPDYQKGVY